MTENKVSIQRLKNFAYEKIPKSHILHTLLLSEPEELEATELVIKIGVWLKLIREGGRT